MDAECGFHTHANGAWLLAVNGPTLLVDIGFDPNYDPVAGAAPVPAINNMAALVDTGATYSHIDTAIAVALNLPVVDKQTLSGSAGAHEVDVYLAQIHVPALNFTIFGQFAGVNLIAGGQSHGALLGRAFLQEMMFRYDGRTGQAVLTKHAPAAPAQGTQGTPAPVMP